MYRCAQNYFLHGAHTSFAWVGVVCLLLAPGGIESPAREEKSVHVDDLSKTEQEKEVVSTVDPPLTSSGRGDSRGGRMPDLIATFMGVEAKGRHFCIIADASTSMLEPIIAEGSGVTRKTRSTRLDYLKKELIQTLRDLKPGAKFSVILFATKPWSMPGPDWCSAGPDVNRMVPWISDISTRGGTVPYPAFQRAFALRPRPDVIFFMSDGHFDLDLASKVAALNKVEPRTVIHTILMKGEPKSAKGGEKSRKTPMCDELKKLEKYVRSHYSDKNPVPPELMAWLDGVRSGIIPVAGKYRYEAQLRIIAAQSGGTFRRVSVTRAKQP